MRIQNILVPVDFSPPSRLALNYGISLARKFRAKLALVHVMEFPGTGTIETQHKDQAVRMLSALVAPEDQDDLDLGVVLKPGQVEDAISSAISERQADILVMGTHGRGLLGRWLIGSVTQSMLRKVSIPLLTVCRVVSPMSFKRILFATDLSESSRQVFGFVLELACMMGSEVTVFNAVERVGLNYGGSEMAPYVGEQDIEEIRRKLADLVAEGARKEVKADALLAEGAAAPGILKAAEENEINLIAIMVQNKGLIERAFLGTTAEQVIREARVPVISIPAATKFRDPEVGENSSEFEENK